MGQNALKKRKYCLIEASKPNSMGQNRSKNRKNCPIERPMRQNEKEKLPHRNL